MTTVDLCDRLVIAIRTEESRPIVLAAFDSELDASRSVQWIASQPELLELVIRAYRLAGLATDVLDQLGAAVGDEPGDDSWIAAWSGLAPHERRRALRGE